MSRKVYEGLYRPAKLYDFTNKNEALDVYVRYMLNRTQKMFRWNNLPDTVPQRDLEIMLQVQGYATFIKYEDDNIYAVANGGLGGEQSVYYTPTLVTLANPHLPKLKSSGYEIDTECVVCRNDSLYIGLMPLLEKYCSQLLESDISLNLASINSRIISLISAADDKARLSAEKYIKDILDGKLGVIADEVLLNEGIKTQPYSTNSSNNIVALLELHKRIYASMWEDIGIRAVGEGKREALSDGEITANDGVLLPLIDDMLQERQLACDKINTLFGLDISVELDSSWKNLKEDVELQQELLEAEVETAENEADNIDNTDNEDDNEDLEPKEGNEDEQDSTE